MCTNEHQTEDSRVIVSLEKLSFTLKTQKITFDSRKLQIKNCLLIKSQLSWREKG